MIMAEMSPPDTNLVSLLPWSGYKSEVITTFPFNFSREKSRLIREVTGIAFPIHTGIADEYSQAFPSQNCAH